MTLTVVPRLVCLAALAGQRAATAEPLPPAAVAAEAASSVDEEEATCALQVAHKKQGSISSSKSHNLPFVPQCGHLNLKPTPKLKSGAGEKVKLCRVGDHVPCPGSGNMCAGNQCCPRSAVSGDKTFPCPSADPFWESQCESPIKVPGGDCVNSPDDNITVPAKVYKLIAEDKDTPPPANDHPEYLKTVSVKPGTIYSFATLAEMGYCGVEHADRVANFHCPVCEASGFTTSGLVPVGGKIWYNDTGTVAFVGKIKPVPDTDSSLDHNTMQEGCLVTVRGSHSWQEWIEDFTAWHHTLSVPGCNGCAVHTGFEETWNALRPGVLKQFAALGCNPRDANTHIYTTGHSLGGAVATFAAFDLHSAGYNIGGSISFEAPRVGNPAFQEKFNQVLSNAVLYRVTFRRDIVVHVPPRMFDYQHTNPEIYYATADLNKVKICHRTEDPDCSYQFSLVTPDDHCEVPYARGCQICGCPTTIFH